MATKGRYSRMLTIFLMLVAAASCLPATSTTSVPSEPTNLICPEKTGTCNEETIICDRLQLANLTILQKLDVSRVRSFSAAYNKLTHIPEEFLHNATNLQNLTLHHNRIASFIASALNNLNALKLLDLSFNRLIEFHLPTKVFRKLNTVNLSNNLLEIINIEKRERGDGDELIYLDLENNSIKHNLNFIRNLTSIRILRIGYNGITNIKTGMIHESINSHLRSLHLNGNKIKNCTFLRHVDSLHYINLSSNDVSTISEDTFKNFTILGEIHLANNTIKDTSFLKNILNQSVISRIDLSHNRISYINITNISNNSLIFMNISYNFLKELSFVRSLTKLTTFSADNNNISVIKNSDISDGYGSSIKRLSIKNNNISNLLFLTSLPNIEELNLSNNSIYEVHDYFRNKNKLNLLNFSNNKISRFEPTSKTKYFILDLSNNLLNQIPCNDYVRNMFIDGNEITDLDIKCLPNLRLLSVSGIVIEGINKLPLKVSIGIQMKASDKVLLKCIPPVRGVISCKEACAEIEDSIFCFKEGTAIASSLTLIILIISVITCVVLFAISIKCYRKNNRLAQSHCTCVSESNGRCHQPLTTNE